MGVVDHQPAEGPAARMASLDGVGHTGLTVAAVRAQETARPDRLFADPLAVVFAAAGGLGPGAGPGGRRGAALRVWVVARTVFLDDLLAEAGQQGCRQVVLLGAGFDARAFRLPWPPGTRCFEVDTPDVLGPKDQVLATERAVPGCERIVVPCDLRDDWPAALRAAGLDPARPTAWIAEGLLVYLAPADVDRLLDTISGLSAPGSWLGLTMTTREAGSFDGTRLGTLRRSQAPDDPAAWLGGRGWAAEITGPREVLRAHGRPLPEQERPEQERPGQERPEEERPGQARPGQERPDRAGQEDGTRPKALLIRATRGRRHETRGTPALALAAPPDRRPPDRRPRPAPDRRPPDRRPRASAPRGGGSTGPAEPQAQAAGPAGDGPRCGPSISGAAVPGSRRVHDRVRQRIRASAPAPDDLGPGGSLRPRAVARVAGHVGGLHAVPARGRSAAAGGVRPGPAHQPRGPGALGVRHGRARSGGQPAGVALRDVPRRAGISKEAVSVSAGWLERRGYAVNEPDPAGGRLRHVRLTPRGEQARGDYHRLADRIGDGWRAPSADGVVNGLTRALRALYAQPDGQEQPLIGAGLVPYPDGWRAHPPYQRLTEAMIADPAGALPHYPMVTHRGGYPDGS